MCIRDSLLRIMGSPDLRQIDGMGGADPLTSKVAIVRKSNRSGVDIDYLFLQVFVEKKIVTESQNCGNILAGVAPFSIERDLKYRIPFTKRVLDVATKDIVVYASPWSPPAFMKTNGNMLLGGKLKKEYYPAWANYFAKFIKAYEKEGIPIWGMTIQNEPMAVQRWESWFYYAEEEPDFFKNNIFFWSNLIML